MQKPKDCQSCPARRQGSGDCLLQPAARKYNNFEEQYEHCPLNEDEENHE